MPLHLVATCAFGLEKILAGELATLGVAGTKTSTGAVTFEGGWPEVWRANWRLRTANRVLVELGSWPAADGDALAAGAGTLVAERRSWGGIPAGELFDPGRTISVRATSSRSQVRDVRWAALKVKDGVVDAQRRRFGRRASVARRDPDLPLRLWLHEDQATLLVDTSGEPLDRRGYRLATATATLRETLAAAVVLATGWDGRGPVVDPMCGAGTLLAEAAWIALGTPPGTLRRGWAFERLLAFDAGAFAAVRAEPLPTPGADVRLYGTDLDPAALSAAGQNLDRAGLAERTVLLEQDGLEFAPPPGPGLLVVNPPYGERLEGETELWRRLGDLLKRRYTGWSAAVLAGDPGRGKWIGLKPRLKLPVKNGPLDARILVFDLY